MAQVKTKNYQIACQRHFEYAHPKAHGVSARPDGVGNHPNAFFKASRVYHQELHAAKNPDAAPKPPPTTPGAAALPAAAAAAPQNAGEEPMILAN